jgi:hypothetical protein
MQKVEEAALRANVEDNTHEEMNGQTGGAIPE